MKLIGLTGNIACGKSTVLRLLEQRGAVVIDADKLTHDLQQPGQQVYHEIVAAFGSSILAAPDGPIDRKKLATIVFTDPAQLKRLEAIVHPAVRARIFVWLGQLKNSPPTPHTPHPTPHTPHPTPHTPHPSPLTPRLAVLDAIKLLESGWDRHVDGVWVVTCNPEQQLRRLVETRSMSEDEARMRIAAQPPQADKIARANVVINNSGTLAETERQVEMALFSLS